MKLYVARTRCYYQKDCRMAVETGVAPKFANKHDFLWKCNDTIAVALLGANVLAGPLSEVF